MRIKNLDKRKKSIIGSRKILFIKHVDVFMVDIAESTEGVEPGYEEQMKVVFPRLRKSSSIFSIGVI